MAARKPLVDNGGEIEQLQPGDTLDAVISTADEAILTNGSASSLLPGSPVYISAASTIQPSRANTSGSQEVIGLVGGAAIAAGATGAIRKDGTLTLTTAQWDAVTGGTGGLTAGASYWLSEATAGRLVTAAPATGWHRKLGKAMSTVDFEIQIEKSIKQ